MYQYFQPRQHAPFVAVALAIGLFFGAVGVGIVKGNERDDQLAVEKRATQVAIDTAVRDHDAQLARITSLEGQVAILRRNNDDMRARLSDAAERERSLRVRASRSRRVVVSPTHDAPAPSTGVDKAVDNFSSSSAWASSAFARKVANCESGGNPRAVNASGKYRGKWQMDASFWRTYGGLQYASTPDRATEAQQDSVAYRGWQDRGWSPWSCAR